MSRFHDTRFPRESAEYRAARDELLSAERELREQTERVAALRRRLPLGGVADDYVFTGEDGEVRLSELFEDGKDTLVAYSFMYGPESKNPCPLCTSVIDGLNGNAPDIRRRCNLVVVAKSPIDRIREFADRRDWSDLRFVSSHDNSYNADYHGESPDGSSQWPMMNVFVRSDDSIHHFWASELFFTESEDGQDSRHVDVLWPLWNVLDLTPGGRSDFYPGLDYKVSAISTS